MVAGKYGYYWECHDGTVSMDLEAIWGMSDKSLQSNRNRLGAQRCVHTLDHQGGGEKIEITIR
jgi:hypothetical protein